VGDQDRPTNNVTNICPAGLLAQKDMWAVGLLVAKQQDREIQIRTQPLMARRILTGRWQTVRLGNRSSAGAPVLVYRQGAGPVGRDFRVSSLPLLLDTVVRLSFPHGVRYERSHSQTGLRWYNIM
jgi:hypothetical protein